MGTRTQKNIALANKRLLRQEHEQFKADKSEVFWYVTRMLGRRKKKVWTISGDHLPRRTQQEISTFLSSSNL